MELSAKETVRLECLRLALGYRHTAAEAVKDAEVLADFVLSGHPSLEAAANQARVRLAKDLLTSSLPPDPKASASGESSCGTSAYVPSDDSTLPSFLR